MQTHDSEIIQTRLEWHYLVLAATEEHHGGLTAEHRKRGREAIAPIRSGPLPPHVTQSHRQKHQTSEELPLLVSNCKTVFGRLVTTTPPKA